MTTYDDPSAGSAVNEVRHSYDDWGNLTLLEQDRDSAISGNEYEVAWSYAKATGGRNTIRRSGTTYPNGDALTYTYLSSGNSLDDSLSRLTRITHGATLVAAYTYLGDGMLVSTELPEPNVISALNGASTGSYAQVDRFNRVIDSRWTALTPSPDVNFYNVDLAYDRNSNILTAEDQVHAGFDVTYTVDNLDRLTAADEGTLGGAITRTEDWALSQTGNWADNPWDYNGDADYLDVGAADTDRTYSSVTYNEANEQTARSNAWGNGTGTPTTTTYTITHDAAGNLTDDGWNYKHEYDAWNRLRFVKNQSNNLVAEFTYNGLGHRVGWHYDVDDGAGNGPDGIVDGNDDWLYFAYDDRWRIAATFWEGADPDEPYEQFTYHNAGLDGEGGSSYIDAVVLRDRDEDVSEDGVLEERVYICQNWRADVSALLTDAGIVIGWAKYSAYGVPHGLPGGDTDSDGDFDGTDATAITGGGGYDVRKDVNLDGSADIFDATDAANIHGGTITLGRNVMTGPAVALRKGYAGYELDPSLFGTADKGRTFWHVRHRVLDSGLGRWVQRDPAGYVDGAGLYLYASSDPIARIDTCGLADAKQIELTFAPLQFTGNRSGFVAKAVTSLGLPQTWPCDPDTEAWIVQEVRGLGNVLRCNGSPYLDFANRDRGGLGIFWEAWRIKRDGQLNLPLTFPSINWSQIPEATKRTILAEDTMAMAWPWHPKGLDPPPQFSKTREAAGFNFGLVFLGRIAMYCLADVAIDTPLSWGVNESGFSGHLRSITRMPRFLTSYDNFKSHGLNVAWDTCESNWWAKGLATLNQRIPIGNVPAPPP